MIKPEKTLEKEEGAERFYFAIRNVFAELMEEQFIAYCVDIDGVSGCPVNMNDSDP